MHQGETTKQVVVDASKDLELTEMDETFILTLSAPDNGTIDVARNTFTGTIENRKELVWAHATNAYAVEGVGANLDPTSEDFGVFTISRGECAHDDGTPNQTRPALPVRFQVDPNSTAVRGVDYILAYDSLGTKRNRWRVHRHS